MPFPTHAPCKGFVLRLLIGCLLLLTAGCRTWRADIADAATAKPYARPLNFSGEKQLPSNLRRVLVLPVFGGKVAEVESCLIVDEVLLGTLQKKTRFEVVTMTREEMQRRFNQPEFSSAAVLPHGFLEELGRVYGVEAVLFVDITVYAPYPPLAVGFRGKLATIADVRLLWSFDETFSASDPALVNSVQRAARQDSSSRLPLDSTVGVFQSPRRFAAFAADLMFDTLPPR